MEARIELDHAGWDKQMYTDQIEKFQNEGYHVQEELDHEKTILIYGPQTKKMKPFHILLLSYDINEPDKWPCGSHALQLFNFLQTLIDPERKKFIIVKKVAYKIAIDDATRIFDYQHGPDLIIAQQFAIEYGFKMAQDLKCAFAPILYNNQYEIDVAKLPLCHLVFLWSNLPIVHPRLVHLNQGNFTALSHNDIWWNLVNRKISIIVPCHGKHINRLPVLLQHFTKFTVQPYEIIISMSLPRNEKLSQYLNIIESCKELYSLVHFHLSLTGLTAAQNRNLGAHQAKGDILLFLDADDQYHPQLIEIILFMWNKYNPVLLGWNYVLNQKCANTNFILDQIKITKGSNLYEKELKEKYLSLGHWRNFGNIHYGHSAVAKNIWEEIKHPDIIKAEDVMHNKLINHKYADRYLLLDAKLTSYRQTESVGLTNF